jgi:membrane associated rhomboid family serine protease
MFPISDGDLQRRSFPYVNVSIIAVCTLVFIYELTLGNQDVFFYQFGLVPVELTQGIDLEFICGNQIF